MTQDFNVYYFNKAVGVISKTALMGLYKKNSYLHPSIPYIWHPLALASTLLPNTDEAIVGLLHDHVEDHVDPIIAEDDLQSFPLFVRQSVSILTHPEVLTYKEYIQAIIESGDWLAMRVKMADLYINLRTCELPGPHSESLKRRYQNAARMLLGYNPDLIIEISDTPRSFSELLGL